MTLECPTHVFVVSQSVVVEIRSIVLDMIEIKAVIALALVVAIRV